MPYVTSIERAGIEKGREEGRLLGMQESVGSVLEAKFGSAGKKLLPKIRALTDPKLLIQVIRVIGSADSIEEVKEHLGS